MCSSTKVKKSQNALVLIPCCKQKNVVAFRGQFQPSVPNIQNLRAQLLQQIRITPTIANRPENQRGILNPNTPLTQAINLYVRNFYKKGRVHLT